MAPSTTGFGADALARRLRSLPAASRYWLGFSGGADSSALLHALVQARRESVETPVSVVHVDHGLRIEARRWVGHCRRVCETHRVTLRVLEVDARARPGESPEAAARRERYAALETLLGADEALLTAHHLDDQVETLLIQMFRGAGPAGLAGMPVSRRLGRGWHLRPLLAVEGAALRGYCTDNAIDWVHDPSNDDRGLDRNFVRHEVVPLLETRWPGIRRTLARVASHQGAANDLLERAASADLALARGARPDVLSRSALLALGASRARNVIRRWLRERGLPTPHATHLERVITELVTRDGGGGGRVDWPGAEIRRYRDELHAMRPLTEVARWSPLSWLPPRSLDLVHGRITARRVRGRGLSLSSLGERPIEIRCRTGGERCRPWGRAHGQRLKRLYQEHAVPPWERPRRPLVYVGGELAAVAGLWVVDGYHARDDEEGWEIGWEDFELAGRHVAPEPRVTYPVE